MKAALALLALYVGTFFVVIGFASQNPQSPGQDGTSAAAQRTAIDPAKEADIRSLMELVGAKDTIEEATNAAAEQYRERLLATMPNNDRAEAFVNAFVDKFKARYNASELSDKIVAAYDKHFTADEVKGLLQFYGSPLGQKTASETPRVTREVQAESRELSARVAKEVLAEMKAQNPDVGQSARLGPGGRRWQQRQQQQQQAVRQQPPSQPQP